MASLGYLKHISQRRCFLSGKQKEPVSLKHTAWLLPHLTASKGKKEQSRVLIHLSLYFGSLIIYLSIHVHVQMFAHVCVCILQHSQTSKKFLPYIVVCSDATLNNFSPCSPFCLSWMFYSFYSEQASLFMSSEIVQGIISKASGFIKQLGAIPPPPPLSLLP